MLNTRFILRGSVRRSADQVRINATLVDATTGRNVWGDRYDGHLKEVFSLQDEITEKIVSALSLKLTPAEQANLRRPETGNMAAYELFLRGRDQFLRFSRENTFSARKLFEQALDLDPDFARAEALLAWTYAFEYTNGWSEDAKRTLARANELAKRAVALNDKLPIAYFVKALVHRERHEFVEALVEAQASIEIDPNYANGYMMLSTILYYAGKPEEGLAMVEKAERVNPVHPSNYPFHKGQALFILKRYDEAIAAFAKGVEQNPTSQRLRVWLAASYAQAGMIEDAEWEADQILLDDPDFRFGGLTHVFPFKNPADREHFNTALRKVGFDDRW